MNGNRGGSGWTSGQNFHYEDHYGLEEVAGSPSLEVFKT